MEMEDARSIVGDVSEIQMAIDVARSKKTLFNVECRSRLRKAAEGATLLLMPSSSGKGE